ncbi:MAG: TIGR00725 family protein [Spirochaetota bacterium]|nr:TIGR00725 family protein [Spirochaetota bacterium]
MNRYSQVVVIGSSDDNSYANEAYQIGKYIASKGWVLISGGRGGIMEAVSKGAREEGGIVIGIIPESDHESANKYCNIVIPTGIGYARNMINVLSGDAIISIGGKSGTLSELAYGWQFTKPIILCAFTGGWSERLSLTTSIDNRKRDLFHIAKNLSDVYMHLDNVLNKK